MTPEQCASARKNEVTTQKVERDAPIVAELLDYIRWLADQDFAFPLTAGQIWAMYYEGVRVGRLWTEVCEDLKLPTRDDWE